MQYPAVPRPNRKAKDMKRKQKKLPYGVTAIGLCQIYELHTAQFLIKFEPKSAATFDNLRRFRRPLYMHRHISRANIEVLVVRRFQQIPLQRGKRLDAADIIVVIYKHEPCRQRPHAFVHYQRVVAVELHLVVYIIQRMVEIHRRLRSEHSRKAHVAGLYQFVVGLFQQLEPERPERVEMESRIGVCLREIGLVLRSPKMITFAAIKQLALAAGEIQKRRIV